MRRDVLLSTIDASQIFNDRGLLLPPKEPIWSELEKKLDGQMSAKYIWLFIYDDRYGIKGTLLASAGYASETQEELQPSEPRPKMKFYVVLPPEVWNEIKPIYCTTLRSDNRPQGTRGDWVVPPNEWAGLLIDAFVDQFEIPCPFTFKRARVAKNPTASRHFMQFESGTCNECGATAEAWITAEPEDNQPVLLTLECTDTRGVVHKTRRQCRGGERRRIGQAIGKGSVQEFRARESLKKVRGKFIPPNFYSRDVLSKAKQEEKERKLQEMNIPVRTNWVDAILHMKYETPFLGCIHFVAVDPILVIYSTPAQLQMNNELAKKYSRFSIDSTGSIVAKDQRVYGSSGEVFLYSVVGSNVTNAHGVPLNQMLSEKQDANVIAFWLNESIRKGYAVPNEFICDNSKALFSALARSVGGCSSYLQYKELCFDCIKRPGETKLPRCFLRLDLAHLINAVRKWKLWSDVPNAIVKEHIMRWFGLLVKAKKIREFEEHLTHLLTLTEATELGGNAAQMSLTHLKSSVAGQETEDITDMEEEDEEKEQEEQDDDTPLNIKTWLQGIKSEASQKSSEEGENPNPYCLKKFAKQLLDLCSSFTVWSAVMVEPYKSPFPKATSAHVESGFDYIKNHVFEFKELPTSKQEFVGRHIISLQGNLCLLMSGADAKQDETALDREELNHSENWRNKAPIDTQSDEEEDSSDESKEKNTPSKTVTETAKYLQTYPQIQLENATMKQAFSRPSKLLLKNGSLGGQYSFIHTDKQTKVQIKNTCAFDAFVSVLGVSLSEREGLRSFVNPHKEKSPSLTVAWSLAHAGAEKKTYTLRTEHLLKVASLNNANMRASERLGPSKSRKTGVLEYSCFGNVQNIIEQLEEKWRSICTTWTCPDNHQHKTKTTLLKTTEQYLHENGLKNLQDSLSFYVGMDSKRCTASACSKWSDPQHELNDLLLIDTSASSTESGQQSQKMKSRDTLDDVPTSITLISKEYMPLGVVAYTKSHYVAYVRSISGKWTLYNDIAKHPYVVPPSTEIDASILIYCNVTIN